VVEDGSANRVIVLVNDQAVARGEVIAIDENFDVPNYGARR